MNALNTITYSPEVADATTFLASSAAKSGADDFLGTPLGKVLLTIFGILGLLVLLFAVVKAIGGFVGGKMGAGFKALAGGILLAGIMFSIPFLPDLIGVISGIVEDMIDSSDQVL